MSRKESLRLVLRLVGRAGIFISILVLLSCGTNKGGQEDNSSGLKNANYSLSSLVDSLDLKKEDLSLIIDKGKYELFVIANDQIIKSYPVVFGSNPIDDKLMEGDRSTPEGQFSVRDYYPHRSWSKFIWIDYPTEDSWRKHRQAKIEGLIPSDATIGGEIGIHGVPEGRSFLIATKSNWTWGCISMTNEDVNDLYPLIYKGMPILIRPTTPSRRTNN